ncbi:sensor histidine kinase [Nonomuraea sp. NPDC046570]|uniref:sensor histidine kinase n=1 Tax=Nonomuraea sp. NPDC046570 TaxID=3155255 RepID=UPI003408CCEF
MIESAFPEAISHPWVRRVLGPLFALWLLYGPLFAGAHAVGKLGWPGTLLALALALIAGFGCLLALWRRWRRWVVPLLVVSGACALGLHALVPYSGFAFVFLIPWMAMFLAPPRQAVAVGLLDALGVLATGTIVGLPFEQNGWSAVGVVFQILFAAIARQLVEARQQALATAQARSREAVLAERTRMAREIHDILAHSLSAQIVHLEGARLLLERDGDKAAVLDRVDRAGGLARGALEEAQRAVEALRGDELPLAEQLDRLAGEFQAAVGSACKVTVTGSPKLVPEARLAVVRTAQEALTNVRKHAPRSRVELTLRDDGEWCELEVRNEGGSPGELVDSGQGYGLIGMRERAELIGGVLEAGVEGEGFLVRLRVPA